ncbi:MAG: hypothetical protein KDC38_15350, partial [Planctomycetes bacterium]|nr:hypothetical protein [Planctomycetota bacterium]
LVASILDRLPAGTRVHFVTHSLGGLIVRELFSDEFASRRWRDSIEPGRICMIFPPNRGAELADRWHERWWFRLAFGRCSDVLTSEQARVLPVPPWPTGVIAGGRGDGRGRTSRVSGDDDGTVGVEETRLEGAAHLVLDVGHTFGMNEPAVIIACRQFLRTGELRAP